MIFFFFNHWRWLKTTSLSSVPWATLFCTDVRTWHDGHSYKKIKSSSDSWWEGQPKKVCVVWKSTGWTGILWRPQNNIHRPSLWIVRPWLEGNFLSWLWTVFNSRNIYFHRSVFSLTQMILTLLLWASLSLQLRLHLSSLKSQDRFRTLRQVTDVSN